MQRLTSDRLVTDPPVAVRTPAAARTTLIWLAWLGTLLLSNLPLIIARDLLGTDIPWITPAWIVLAGVLFGATYAWPALKPLRAYFAVMGAILLATVVLAPAVAQTAAWQRLFPGESVSGVFGDRLLLVSATLIVLLVVFVMGFSRREAFLTAGNMAAPVQGLTLPGRRRLSWAVFGPIMALLLAGLFFAILAGLNPGTFSGLGTAVPWLPLILLTAALNAFGEEAVYRAAPLATLLPAIGARHALWLTALYFGLGHYYGGIPSGPMGLIGTGLLALLLGKAMLDTRGMGWSWVLHVAIDTVIFTTLAIGYATTG